MANIASTMIIVKIEKDKKELLEELVKGKEIYNNRMILENNFLYKVFRTTQRWGLNEKTFEYLLPLGGEIIITSEEGGESLYEKVESYESEDDNGNPIYYFGENETYSSVIKMWEDVLGTDEIINNIVAEEILAEIEYRFEIECENNDIDEISQLYNHMDNLDDEDKEDDFFYELLKLRKNDFEHCLKLNFSEENIKEFEGNLNLEDIFGEL
jgi:hypothetical protein